MNGQFFDRIANLEREHASFAIATVVARRSPVSSHIGDRALVFADGRMEGFVGGSCSRDIVRRQALGAIRNRLPVLLQIRNASESAPNATGAQRDAAAHGNPELDVAGRTERIVIPMSCASEGAVDVYIEPRLPQRQLVVIGLTPVAQAVAVMASALEFDVLRVVGEDELRDLGRPAGVRVLALAALGAYLAALGEEERSALVAIVASQGHYDELALEAFAAFEIGFLGLVASRRRAASVLGVLAQQGVGTACLATIRNPVGLDIGARSPGEVAVSILAEIIANGPPQANDSMTDASASAVDPVCGMDVETASAFYRAEHAGTHYFCCAGCRSSFIADPERYLAALGNA